MATQTLARWSLLATALLAAVPAIGAECRVRSGAERIPVIELYTSEGCDSCPPADRWVSGLVTRKLAPAKVIPLAFHVDYWNQLGWPDRFAQAGFSQRQRDIARRKGAGFVFTPQFVLDGQDYRRGWLTDDLPAQLEKLNRSRPLADLELRLTVSADAIVLGGTASVADTATAKKSDVLIALTENRLATEVRAGENRGKRLEHDFVVRELAGPFAFGDARTLELAHSFRPGADWKRENLAMVAFVQDRGTGTTLQALAAAPCR
jgi:hypothetical protein